MLNKPLNARHILAGVAVYFLCISLASHIPGTTLVELGFCVWDKLAHAVVYLPLGLLVAMGVRREPVSLNRFPSVVISILIVFGFGLLDEIHQAFVPGRFATWSDVAADLIGGTVGAIMAVVGWPFSRSRYRTT